ncbi:hypothetical protein [Succinimonas sp.]|uniref:hypothetical protein n=1 Tax=Succinimonas sp. TaxID=1936151 RepID=UPI00386CCB08
MKSVLQVILIMVVVAVGFYFYQRHELTNMAEETLKDALAGTRYACLSVSSVSGIECQHLHSGPFESRKACTGTAEFSDGTRSRICIKSTEFFIKANNYIGSGTSYKKTSTRVTVSLCGLDAGIKSTRTFHE